MLLSDATPSIDAAEIQIRQITNNNWTDSQPEIAGNNIAWYGWNGNSYGIFRSGGIQPTNLSNYKNMPDIDGSRVVWWQSGEIHYYDGVRTRRITNNTT
ncbi:MAG: hypothetical protein NTU53_01325 [Planctomycetota bacterium]|nr:hypothetical protein [Planctomycetota bacterium]